MSIKERYANVMENYRNLYDVYLKLIPLQHVAGVLNLDSISNALQIRDELDSRVGRILDRWHSLAAMRGYVTLKRVSGWDSQDGRFDVEYIWYACGSADDETVRFPKDLLTLGYGEALDTALRTFIKMEELFEAAIREAAERQRLEREARQTEERERKLLTELKAKYEGK